MTCFVRGVELKSTVGLQMCNLAVEGLLHGRKTALGKKIKLNKVE